MPSYDPVQLRGYLEGLRMSTIMIERIVGFIDEYRVMMGAPPEFVFVENPIDALGAVEFSNLILFAGNTYVEFSINEPNRTITLVNIEKSINRMVMPTIQQMSLSEISERSRLTVQIFDDMDVIGYFAASGSNCDELIDMVRRYVIPAISG